MASSCRRIHTAPCAIVGVIDVLEHGRGFLLEQFRRVGPRQALVQQLLDGHPHLGAGLLAFAPIQHQLPRLERGQQLPGGGLHLLPVRVAHFDLRLGQEVEERQFFFIQLFAHAPLLFFIQALGKGHQLLEELLGVEAARIVGVDHRLESLQIIHARAVEPHHGHELLRHRPLEFLVERALAARLELLGQLLEVDLAQVNPMLVAIGCARLADDVALRGDGAVEQSFHLLHDLRDVRRRCQRADFIGDDLHGRHLGGKLPRRRVGQHGLVEPLHGVGQIEIAALDLLGGHQRLHGVIEQADAGKSLGGLDGRKVHPLLLAQAPGFRQRLPQRRHQCGLVLHRLIAAAAPPAP